jgi:hypothetical protein
MIFCLHFLAILCDSLKSRTAIMKPSAQLFVSAILTSFCTGAGAMPGPGGQRSANAIIGTPSCINDYFSEHNPRTVLIPIGDRGGKWKLVAEPYRLDEKMTFYACLPSEPAPDSRHEGTSAPLFVACGIDMTDKAFIVVEDPRARSHVHVTSTLDETAAEESDWKVSGDRKVILAPGTGRTFAKRLMGHDTLSVQLTLGNEEHMRLKYELTGAPESLDILRKACDWE